VLNNWYDWVGTYTGVVALAVLSFPIAVVTAGLLGWRRKATGAPRPWRTAVAEVGLVYGTAPWVWMTLLPGNVPG
jgi:hypothetical protein